MQTKGWDTISIVKQEKINSNLVSVWSTVDAHFYKELPDSSGYIQGTFGSFQIINGGGGKLVRIKLPIQSGQMFFNETTIALDGLCAIVEVTLSLFSTQNNISVLKTEYNQLAKNRHEITDDKPGWILPIKLSDPEGRTGAFANIILDNICLYLLDNPMQLELIFAEINFAKQTAPSWALPKKCTYSYLDSGYLAIMAVCDDRPISDLPLDIDVTGISLGTSSFYVLSKEIMLKNLILPGLIPIYQNADIKSYTYSEGELYNTEELRMHEIKSGAIYYTPVVYKKGNLLKVTGDYISTSFLGKCDMYAGITMYWEGSLKLKAALGNDGMISFYREGSTFSDDEDIPWYLSWLLPIVGMIVQIVVKVISDDLIDSIKKRSCSIKAGSIDTVTWCQNQAITKSAYIDEALIVEYK
ncbi:MAG: TULIP family P47-like protein [Coprococcus sp.]